ncbi:MAG: M16 family metallopeptidase, partial [Myxococcota bacterium]
MLWLGLALMCGAVEPAVDASLEVDRLKVEATVATLDNGMRVILEQQDRTDVMAVYLHVGVGSRDERDGERGMAHLFEHLMFEGSEHAAGNTYDELLTAAGGDNNASTSEDETDYEVSLPSGALELALFLESDRLGYLPAGLTQAALDNQKDVVLEERARDYGAGHGRDTDALTHLLFVEGHPYHIPAFGTVSDVRGFTLEGIRAFHKRWYQPSNVILSIVGNVEPAHALKRVEHWFSDVPSGSVPDRQPPAPPPVLQDDAFALLQDDAGRRTLYRTW